MWTMLKVTTHFAHAPVSFVASTEDNDDKIILDLQGENDFILIKGFRDESIVKHFSPAAGE